MAESHRVNVKVRKEKEIKEKRRKGTEPRMRPDQYEGRVANPTGIDFILA